ncbi:MAG: hypothetical protein U5K70_00815 [Halodesulfurarchaeum sp.]|nr:hypothetical protein [Halodesulfurarchaeum sp.]
MSDVIRSYLADLEFPVSDAYERTASAYQYPDGSDFKIEMLPGSVEEYEALLKKAETAGVQVNKIVDVTGTTFDSEETILEKCRIARENDVQLLMEPGRGHKACDNSQQMALGAMPGGKLRGEDTLVYTLDEMKRATELGCRGFNLQDEGLLQVAIRMRDDGLLPSDTVFKLSSAFQIANPASMQFWSDKLGSHDSINPARDLTIPMLGAIREVTGQPMDIHAFWYQDVVRTPEMPEIVRVASPVSIKNFKTPRPGEGSTDILTQFEQSLRVVEEIEASEIDATQYENDPDTPGVPGEPVQ